MNLSEIFIRRPVMTTLVMAAILLFGILAYPQLPVSDLPSVDFPTINVSASLPGASPETMASAVATPLEKQFATIAGVDAITSSSGLGSTTITLQFGIDRDIDAAAQDVQAMISRTLRQLPQGMLPPSYQKVNPADSPILFLSLTSATMPLPELNEYAENFLAQRIASLAGVAQVQVFGSQKYAVRVQVDPVALATRGIGIDEVATAIDAGNVNLPTGVLQGPSRAFTLDATGELRNAADFRQLIVAYRNGAPVRLGDLATVIDGVQNSKTAGWYRGTRAITLAVQRQPGANTVAVADAVRALLDRLRPQLPGAVEAHLVFDRSQSIRHSVADVQFTLMLTLCLVVLVIFLFLRSLSATLIPSLALPFSVVGTFAAMHLLGFSLNNLSLMALTLSVGFVVDDAIVMLENIVRHMEKGKAPGQAALDGSREVGFTILSMTLSLVAVFIPVIFMGGLLGRLFREFAITIGVSILVSGLVSLTLTPMLGARLLRHRGERKHGALYQMSERAFDRSLRAYERSLEWVMRRRGLAMVFSAIILAGTVALFMLAPKGFLPNEDIGQIIGTTETAEGTSFDSMVEHQRKLAKILDKEPDIRTYTSSVGAGGAGGLSNTGRLFIYLKPRHERHKTADEIIRALQPKLSQVPGIRVFLQVPPTIRIGGRLTKSLYQFTMQGPDIEDLYEAAGDLEQKLRLAPELKNVTTDLQIKSPGVKIDIDRDRAAALGVTPERIEGTLYDAYGSRQVSTIFTSSDQYWVVLELLPRYQEDPAALSLLRVRSSNGELVPLTSIARVVSYVGPLTVNHSGQFPSVTLSFDLADDVSLGQAVDAVQRTARETLPASIATSFAGTAQAFQSSQQGLLFLLLVAILVIYIVLGILYESFIHPITILSGLPFAGFGALLTLLLTRTQVDIYAFVGIILLVGLVKKNAIMMIDFALDAERTEGKDARSAILQAASVRFRPIMMTTMAALVGTLPIAIGFGAGSESRRPLGIAVVGGLAFSQIITLYVTPVIYTYLDSFQRRFARGPKKAATENGVATPEAAA